jgi:hypothetical protein
MVRGNVPSSVKVGVQGETAVRADKTALRLTDKQQMQQHSEKKFNQEGVGDSSAN